jgi:hypothetical protein
MVAQGIPIKTLKKSSYAILEWCTKSPRVML